MHCLLNPNGQHQVSFVQDQNHNIQTGVLASKCIFGSKIRKQINNILQTLTKDATKQLVKKFAKK